MRNFVLTIAFSLCASVASAGITNIQVVQTAVVGSPAGFVVNDILLDFDSQLMIQQMVVELTNGSIYNHHTFGSHTAPNPALFGVDPAIAADSFVTVGGADSFLSDSTFILGGSNNLGLNGPLQLDNVGINIAWGPFPSAIVPNGAGYMTARVTLSDDAQGAAFYFGSAGDPGSGDPARFEGTIVNGVMSLALIIPEPSTAAILTMLGLVGVAGRRVPLLACPAVRTL